LITLLRTNSYILFFVCIKWTSNILHHDIRHNDTQNLEKYGFSEEKKRLKFNDSCYYNMYSTILEKRTIWYYTCVTSWSYLEFLYKTPWRDKFYIGHKRVSIQSKPRRFKKVPLESHKKKQKNPEDFVVNWSGKRNKIIHSTMRCYTWAFSTRV